MVCKCSEGGIVSRVARHRERNSGMSVDER